MRFMLSFHISFITKTTIYKDPTVFTTGYKKNRFYCFSSREVDTEIIDRDIFNEKPTKEETMAAQQVIIMSQKNPLFTVAFVLIVDMIHDYNCKDNSFQ
jgi:hypothetical protein